VKTVLDGDYLTSCVAYCLAKQLKEPRRFNVWRNGNVILVRCYVFLALKKFRN
jgi:hypothetical protein